MPRPSSPWPYWRTPGFNPAADAQDDNHLPDDVVAMFRDSLDPNGLDFLKRGPRTPAERLAYAQRVGPEAHLSARPAPLDVQRRFTDQGIVDQNRYFVGPDRVAYLRGPESAEPAYFGTRRGFETAVGGFEPVEFEGALAEIGNADASGTDQRRGIDGLDYAVDPLPVPPSVRFTDSAEQAIDEIEKRYRAYAEYGRKHGHDEAAAAMERFLSGSGQAMRLDPSWLRSQPSVQGAEGQVLQYFTEWLTGYRPSRSPSEQFIRDLPGLADGATLQGASTWTARFTPDFMFEQNALATVGQSNLTGTGNFTFRRRGDRILFDGVVAMVLDDTYDWQPGEWGIVPSPDGSFPGYEINRHDDAIKLQNHRGAKPFRLLSQWWKSVHGAFAVENNGVTLEFIRWQDRQR
ncbi:MAG: hypothetical protein AB7P12_15015 [Alphaproteobacteria bacterium]